ncbi:MAG: LssY C-terminal domain-containing protein [Candidatus Paceibacterota bacterium]|jgi:undecaprenyl-diphosphatase
MKRFTLSILKSFANAARTNEYSVRLQRYFPTLFSVLAKRTSWAGRYGFRFVAGMFVSLCAFLYFLDIAIDVLFLDPFVEADKRIMNLVAALRNIPSAEHFLFFTSLGNWEIVISLGAAVFLMLWLFKRKNAALVFAGSVVSGAGFTYFLKLFMHRTRPGIGYSMIEQGGYAFPSGHAIIAFALYGMIGYFVMRTVRHRFPKFLVALATLALVLTIGLSRIYLGVHWTSDVAAGWWLGFSILVFWITLYEERERFAKDKEQRRPGKRALFVALLIILVEGLFIVRFTITHPLALGALPEQKMMERIEYPFAVDAQALINDKKFPKFSETLVGEKMEPVSFIVIGWQDQLVTLFRNAGWFVADKPSIQSLSQLIGAAIFKRPYPTAPVTPSFLQATAETIAFEKATETNSIAQRHHTRFWLTHFEVGGVPVWVATASFDDGLRYYVTHKIKPDIDTERDFIKDEITTTAILVESVQELQLVPRMMGMNQGRDQFFTDGKAYVIRLR